MSPMAERLKKEEAELIERLTAEGKQAGCEWAENRATPTQLAQLNLFVENGGLTDWSSMLFAAVANQVTQRIDDHVTVGESWEDVLDQLDDGAASPVELRETKHAAFVAAFATGAVERYRDFLVESKLTEMAAKPKRPAKAKRGGKAKAKAA